jgi:hypothetical protein
MALQCYGNKNLLSVVEFIGYVVGEVDLAFASHVAQK